MRHGYAITASGAGPRERAGGAGVALLLLAAIGWALIAGLATHFSKLPEVVSQTFALLPEPPRPPEPKSIPPKARSKRPEGAAAPAGLRAKASEIVAPEPVIIPPPPPVVVSPIAGVGAATHAGNSDTPGPGPGSGGLGNGTGSGGSGDGDGGGWEDETPPMRIRGRLSDRDFPRNLGDEGISGTVGVRYVVRVDGRVGACRISRSSGSAELDAHTCRLIQERFRFRPARDARGEAVESTIVENHSWDIEIEPDERR